MNRREVLALFAAMACGTPRKSRPTRKQHAQPIDAPIERTDDGWSPFDHSQLGESPLVVSGNVIAHAKHDELEFLDATTLARLNYIGDRYDSICALRTGLLVAYTKHVTRGCEIDVIEGSNIVGNNPLPCPLAVRGTLLPGTRSEFYLRLGWTSLARYRIANGSIFEVDTTYFDERLRNRIIGDEQLVGLGDGRVLATAGRTLQMYQPQAPMRRLATVGSTAHVATGAGDRIWYSVWNRDGAIERVVLSRLGNELTTEVDISFGPSRIIHMASGTSGALAVLLFTKTDEKPIWTLVFLDESGRELWRRQLEDDFFETEWLNMNLSHVAVAPKRVLLRAQKGLYAWDAANGTRIRF